MIDLELSYSWAGGSEPLHLFWDYESDIDQIGVIVERRQLRGDAIYIDYRAADNSVWVATPDVIQTKDYSLTLPPYWSTTDQTAHSFYVRLFFADGSEHLAELHLGG